MDESDVHNSVARLSISELDGNESRRKFLDSLKEAANGNGTVSANNNNSTFNTSPTKFAPQILKKKPSEGKPNKRRRSSVQQGTQLRKKKILLFGEPSISINEKSITKKLTVPNLRDFLLWSLTDFNEKPNWCTIENRQCINKLIFVFVPGLSSEEFGKESFKDLIKPLQVNNCKIPEELSFIKKEFNQVFPLITPGSKKSIYNSLETLTKLSLSKKEKKRLLDQIDKKKLKLKDLLMTKDQLIENNYPMDYNEDGSLNESTNDFVKTVDLNNPENGEENIEPKAFAIDCEMCNAESGKVLTRVSLVDFNGKVIIDELVKPDEEIIDYVTKYSGISEEMLKDVKTSLKDIQEKLLGIISSRDYLIGHSLESDLNVLKLKHFNIIDTAICFDHPRGPPSKISLKNLMLQYLSKKIQDSEHGHDSIEDSISCIELIKLKLSKNYLFGKNLDEETIFKKINKMNKKNLINGEKLSKNSIIIDYFIKKNSNCYQVSNNLMYNDIFKNVEVRQKCDSDDDSINKTLKAIDEDYDLIITKLRDLEEFKRRRNIEKDDDENGNDDDTKSDSLAKKDEESKSTLESQNDSRDDDYSDDNSDSFDSDDDSDDLSICYQNLNRRLKSIYDNLPNNSIMIICSGTGNTNKMYYYQNIWKIYQNEYNKHNGNTELISCERWNQDKVDKLKEAVDTARDSLFLIKLKKNENVISGDESESVSIKSVSPSPISSPNPNSSGASATAATTTTQSRPTGFGGVVFGANNSTNAAITTSPGSSSSSSIPISRFASSLSTQVTFGVDHQDEIDNDESAILED
ncbi:hypothetical protein B5S32_g1123 [[Candida] boidinii]|nr:hypothetical protein B5S32_g1123 [[Candida] boidinii]